MNGLLKLVRRDRRQTPGAFALMVLVCLALLALLTVVQVAHVHSVATDADHCPLCLALHTAAPVAAAAAVIVLVALEAAAQVFEPTVVRTFWHPQIFIRPPPSGATALRGMCGLA